MGSSPNHSQIPDGKKTNQTPYSAWLQTEILHTLQQTVSDHPGEYAFLINVQVQELYWALIVKEMQAAQACLREDNLAEAHEALLRAVDHHEPLNATWRSLSWITPSDLMPILAAVGATHGRDTALQGWTYRHMVYLFGIKQEQHLKHFEPQPHRFEQLQKALNESSLYDDVLAFLSRRGFKIPAEVLRRAPSRTYAPAPGVETGGRRCAKPTPRSKCSAGPWPTSPRNLQPGSIVISWRHVAQSEIDRRISVPRLCLGFCRRWKRFPFLNSFRPAPSSATSRQFVLT